MPRSDRHDRGALVALALILFAVVLVAGVTAFRYPAHSEKSASGQTYVQKNAENDVHPSVARPDDFNPWADPIDQWFMAAFSAVGAGISILALVWVRGAFLETKRTADAAVDAVKAAEEANKIARISAERQLRPYVLYDRAKINQLHFDGKIRLGAEIGFRNGGQSPGIVTAASSAVYAPVSSGKWGQIFAGWERCRVVIGPNQIEPMRFQAIESNDDGKFGAFIIGILLWYESAYGDRYEDAIWLTFDGGLRQVHDQGFALYRPEQDAPN